MAGSAVWQARPPLNIARGGLAGAKAAGRIVVTGGFTSVSGSDVLLSVERRDSGGVWTEGADPTPMPTPRGNAAAAELNGRIYVIGGYSLRPDERCGECRGGL